jgi:hypothetical protein
MALLWMHKTASMPLVEVIGTGLRARKEPRPEREDVSASDRGLPVCVLGRIKGRGGYSRTGPSWTSQNASSTSLGEQA